MENQEVSSDSYSSMLTHTKKQGQKWGVFLLINFSPLWCLFNNREELVSQQGKSFEIIFFMTLYWISDLAIVMELTKLH